MSTSSLSSEKVPGTFPPPELEALSAVLEGPITSIEPLGGGRNSRVDKVWGPSGKPQVVKSYMPPDADGRDRLATEFASLTFLWEQGLRSIPRPIHVNME